MADLKASQEKSLGPNPVDASSEIVGPDGELSELLSSPGNVWQSSQATGSARPI